MGKKIALLFLVLVITGACVLTSPALSVAPGAAFSLSGFVNSLMGVGMVLVDLVGGGGSGGLK